MSQIPLGIFLIKSFLKITIYEEGFYTCHYPMTDLHRFGSVVEQDKIAEASLVVSPITLHTSEKGVFPSAPSPWLSG